MGMLFSYGLLQSVRGGLHATNYLGSLTIKFISRSNYRPLMTFSWARKQSILDTLKDLQKHWKMGQNILCALQKCI